MIPHEAKPRKRTYVLMPPVPFAADGGDDAKSSVAAATDADAEPKLSIAMSFSASPAVAPAEAAPSPEPTTRVDAAPPLAPAPQPSPLDESLLQESALEDEVAEVPTADEVASETPLPPTVSGPSPATQLLFAVIPSVLGAVAAYFAAQQQGWDAPTWAAIGGAVGFVVGWGSLLWIRRKD